MDLHPYSWWCNLENDKFFFLSPIFRLRMGLSKSVAAPKSSDYFDFPSLNGKKLGYTVYDYPTVDGCEILHHQKDG